jgi:hypothetical protein
VRQTVELGRPREPFSNASFSGSYVLGTENPSANTVTTESGVLTDCRREGKRFWNFSPVKPNSVPANQSFNFTDSFGERRRECRQRHNGDSDFGEQAGVHQQYEFESDNHRRRKIGRITRKSWAVKTNYEMRAAISSGALHTIQVTTAVP